MKKENEEKIENLLFNSGLYDELNIEESEIKNFANDYDSNSKGPTWGFPNYYGPKIKDVYCNECKKDSIFKYCKSESVEINKSKLYYMSKAFSKGSTDNIPPKGIGILKNIVYKCSRNEEHKLIFNLIILHKKIIKIGQYPSIRNIDSKVISKYRKILNEKDIEDLNKAIGLFSHGIGVGSFVYLRRITERLLHRIYDENKMSICKKENISEEKFKSIRVSEKFNMLQNYLPKDFNSYQIYRILSKGIHELEEEKCIEYFPIIKQLVYLILDENIRIKEKKENESNIVKLMNEINEKESNS